MVGARLGVTYNASVAGLGIIGYTLTPNLSILSAACTPRIVDRSLGVSSAAGLLSGGGPRNAGTRTLVARQFEWAVETDVAISRRFK